LPLNFVDLTQNDQVTWSMGSTRHADVCMANI